MKQIPTSKSTPQNIADAYEELSPQAFAAWIRLSSADKNDFSSREKTADLLNYSKSQTNIIIRELNALKYVAKYRTDSKTRATGFVLLKKPTISGPNGFVVLSHLLANSELKTKKVDSFTFGRRKRPTQKSIISNLSLTSKTSSNYAGHSDFLDVRPKKRPMRNTDLQFLPKPLECLGGSDLNIQENPLKPDFDGPKSRSKPRSEIGKTVNEKRGKRSNKKANSKKASKKNVDLNPGLSGANLDTPIVLKTMDLEIYKKKYKKYKKEKSNKIKSKRLIRISRRDMSVGGKPTSKPQPDWNKLEQSDNKKQKITFSPTKKQRAQYIEIFDRSNRSIDKKELLQKFGSEVGRIYSRYRRLLQREANCEPTYGMRPTDSKYTKKIAELCIRKSVTPRQVLAYWHIHIGNFSDARLLIPPLAFLSSPANIETVACSDLTALEPDEAAKRMSPGANSFSDLKLYDSRVRETLKKGGFKVNKFSDKDLMSIQFSARTIAKGIDLFVDDELRPMIEHLAGTLYKGLKPEF